MHSSLRMLCSIPRTMSAVEIAHPGGPEVLRLTQRPVPRPGPGELLVRVAAAGVNRPDCVQRLGQYPAPKGVTDIPGLEIAGQVVEAGPGAGAAATRAVLGAEVAALVPGGGYAQYAVASAGSCLPLPAGLSLEQAAALPETCFTVWYNMIMRGGLVAGQRVLVHGGTGGIGSTAIQLAAARGIEVLATAGSAAKCEASERLGAGLCVNYNEEDFVEAARASGGVDWVLDCVGGPYLGRNLKCLREGGTLCCLGFLGGSKAEINLTRVMLKKLNITGSTLRSQPVAAKARIAKQVKAELWPLVESGRILPLLDTANVLPLAEAVEAHRRMESGDLIGKIVLIP